MEQELKIRWKSTYMDDMICCFETKKEAKHALYKIEKFLKEKLGLRLNSKTQIFKSNQGVNYCGYKINKDRIKIRDRGKKNLKRKVNLSKKGIKSGELGIKECKKYLSRSYGIY